MRSPDFYVGYLAQAPPALGRFMRRIVVALVLGATGLAAVLASLQAPFEPGVFEFGVVREFEGTIQVHPYPILIVDPPRRTEDRAVSDFLLVAFGKHGATPEIEAYDGRRVTLRGSLIYREGESMVEIQSGSVKPAASSNDLPRPGDQDLGEMTLRGEIVDSKCFLGVMKPGRGKPHRACATRCISGGIPPVLRVEAADGTFRHFLLTDEAGAEVNARILDFVAEPVEITGQVSRRGDLLVLAADPLAFRRL